MIQPEGVALTIDALMQAVGAKEPSVRKALEALGIEGRRDLADRRYVVYPPDTAERIRQWLLSQK